MIYTSNSTSIRSINDSNNHYIIYMLFNIYKLLKFTIFTKRLVNNFEIILILSSWFSILYIL